MPNKKPAPRRPGRPAAKPAAKNKPKKPAAQKPKKPRVRKDTQNPGGIDNAGTVVLGRTICPAPDGDGWIEHTGGECPVSRGTLIDVQYRCGEVRVGLPALGFVPGPDASVAFWIDYSTGYDIIRYRLSKHADITAAILDPDHSPEPDKPAHNKYRRLAWIILVVAVVFALAMTVSGCSDRPPPPVLSAEAIAEKVKACEAAGLRAETLRTYYDGIIVDIQCAPIPVTREVIQ